jgi:hypothetical protein
MALFFRAFSVSGGIHSGGRSAANYGVGEMEDFSVISEKSRLSIGTSEKNTWYYSSWSPVFNKISQRRACPLVEQKASRRVS